MNIVLIVEFNISVWLCKEGGRWSISNFIWYWLYTCNIWSKWWINEWRNYKAQKPILFKNIIQTKTILKHIRSNLLINTVLLVKLVCTSFTINLTHLICLKYTFDNNVLVILISLTQLINWSCYSFSVLHNMTSL